MPVTSALVRRGFAVDRAGYRVADDRLPDLPGDSAERRHRVRKRRRGGDDRIFRRDIPGQNERAGEMRRAFGVGEADPVDENIARENVRGRLETDLPGERDVFVLVVAADKDERIFIAKTRDRGRDAVAGDTDAADEVSAFVERHAAGRCIERGEKHRHERVPRRRTKNDDASRRPEFVDIGKEKAR